MGEHLETKMTEMIGKIGRNKTVFLVMQALGCSTSKADKLVGRRYPYQLCESEKRALAELFGSDQPMQQEGA